MIQKDGEQMVHPVRMTPCSTDYIIGGVTKKEKDYGNF